jgi:two-component system sensor histidine kinase KdpD
VYLGMAAGVGKTIACCRRARCETRGVDIAIGLVETHGRTDSAAVIADLQVIREDESIQGVTLQEMDLEAILARRPDIVVVDELPLRTRQVDVRETLAGRGGAARRRHLRDDALNVQHLEGVQDIVRRDRHRHPSSSPTALRGADSIVVVDLPVSGCRSVCARKIYAPDQAERALQNFFRSDMLALPARLALLQTADIAVGPAASDVSPKIAVALPFDPATARALILRGSRLAGRMNMKWLALYVRRSRDRAENMSATEHRQLADNVQLAMSLGASVVFEESEDVAGAILEFIRKNQISLLVVGRPSRRGFVARLSPGIVDLLKERVEDCDLLIAHFDTRET